MKWIQKETKQVKKAGLSCCKYGFVSRSGFEPDVETDDLILINIDELFRSSASYPEEKNTDSITGILYGDYDLKSVREERLKEKYETGPEHDPPVRPQA